MSEAQGMSDGILRQRRNLVVFSVLLCFMKFAEVDIGQVSILGFSFSAFGNPDGVYLFAWLIWGYFFYRYWQYYGQEAAPLFAGIIGRELDKGCSYEIGQIVGQSHSSWTDDKNLTNYTKLKSNNWLFEAKYIVNPEDPAGDYKYMPFELPIPKKELRGAVVAVYFNFFFRKSITSDYLLPFIVAWGALLYAGVLSWEGGLLTQVFNLF